MQSAATISRCCGTRASDSGSAEAGLSSSYYTFSPMGDMKCNISYFPCEVIKNLAVMRNNEVLTDVRLEVGNEVFRVHKLVLAAASPYFKAMFTTGLREQDSSTVRLQGVCPTVVGTLISFMYSGEIVINQLSVCHLLPTAAMFQINPVIQACCTFLENQLDPSNALGILNFAEQHGCSGLRQAAMTFVDQHFIQVCQEEEFLELSPCQLVSLIRRDELNVREERDVYNAVLKWVRHDEDNRRPKIASILREVRCQYLSPHFLRDQVENCDILKKVPACKEHLATIFKELTLHKRPCINQRTPSAPCVLYVAGGFCRGPLESVECFNNETKTWTSLAPLPKARSGVGGALLGGLFYVVGGRMDPRNLDCRDVDAYDPVTDEWRSCAPLQVARHRVGVAVLDSCLYAVGGACGRVHHNSVEKYNPEENCWTLAASMAIPRIGVGVAVVNRLMYAIGGFDGQHRLSSVECLHPERNEWNFVSPMNFPRSGAGVAVLGNYVYVAGGHDGTSHLNSMERYDTERDCWTLMAPMQTARSALNLAVLKRKLYAMGGYDGEQFVDVVEEYNPETNTWSPAPSLTCRRSGHASAVSCPPCMAHVDVPGTGWSS